MREFVRKTMREAEPDADDAENGRYVVMPGRDVPEVSCRQQTRRRSSERQPHRRYAEEQTRG